MKGMDEKLFHLQEIEAGIDDLREGLREIQQDDLNRIPFETTLAALLEEMKGLQEEMKALRKGIRRAMEQRDAAAVEISSARSSSLE